MSTPFANPKPDSPRIAHISIGQGLRNSVLQEIHANHGEPHRKRFEALHSHVFNDRQRGWCGAVVYLAQDDSIQHGLSWDGCFGAPRTYLAEFLRFQTWTDFGGDESWLVVCEDLWDVAQLVSLGICAIPYGWLPKTAEELDSFLVAAGAHGRRGGQGPGPHDPKRRVLLLRGLIFRGRGPHLTVSRPWIRPMAGSGPQDDWPSVRIAEVGLPAIGPDRYEMQSDLGAGREAWEAIGSLAYKGVGIDAVRALSAFAAPNRPEDLQPAVGFLPRFGDGKKPPPPDHRKDLRTPNAYEQFLGGGREVDNVRFGEELQRALSWNQKITVDALHRRAADSSDTVLTCLYTIAAPYMEKHLIESLRYQAELIERERRLKDYADGFPDMIAGLDVDLPGCGELLKVLTLISKHESRCSEQRPWRPKNAW